ncbi:MAG: hypothetical protein VB835_11310, partial [Pirellulales bacterium]
MKFQISEVAGRRYLKSGVAARISLTALQLDATDRQKVSSPARKIEPLVVYSASGFGLVQIGRAH